MLKMKVRMPKFNQVNQLEVQYVARLAWNRCLQGPVEYLWKVINADFISLTLLQETDE